MRTWHKQTYVKNNIQKQELKVSNFCTQASALPILLCSLDAFHFCQITWSRRPYALKSKKQKQKKQDELTLRQLAVKTVTMTFTVISDSSVTIRINGVKLNGDYHCLVKKKKKGDQKRKKKKITISESTDCFCQVWIIRQLLPSNRSRGHEKECCAWSCVRM